MCAADSKVWLRARTWQSHRTTRRSLFFSLSRGPSGLAGIVFQPVPAHNGQSSPRGLADENSAASILRNSIPFDDPFEILYSTLHPDVSFPQVRTSAYLCTSCAHSVGAVEKGGKPVPAPRAAGAQAIV